MPPTVMLYFIQDTKRKLEGQSIKTANIKEETIVNHNSRQVDRSSTNHKQAQTIRERTGSDELVD